MKWNFAAGLPDTMRWRSVAPLWQKQQCSSRFVTFKSSTSGFDLISFRLNWTGVLTGGGVSWHVLPLWAMAFLLLRGFCTRHSKRPWDNEMLSQRPAVSVSSDRGRGDLLFLIYKKKTSQSLSIVMQRRARETCAVVSDVAWRERASESICGLMQCWKCQL